MSTRIAALLLSAALITAPAMAQQDTEVNKQAPAPQGTVAPPSNEKAQSGVSTGTTNSEEQKKTQSPGKSVETDLSKKSQDPASTGAGSGESTNKEATNPESPAPNNTVKPQ